MWLKKIRLSKNLLFQNGNRFKIFFHLFEEINPHYLQDKLLQSSGTVISNSYNEYWLVNSISDEWKERKTNKSKIILPVLEKKIYAKNARIIRKSRLRKKKTIFKSTTYIHDTFFSFDKFHHYYVIHLIRALYARKEMLKRTIY